MCDGAQPTPHRFPPCSLRRFVRQDQKGGLQDVFDVVVIAQNSPTCPLYAQPMAPDQGRESGLFAMTYEPFQ
jgi:hypothetical protein